MRRYLLLLLIAVSTCQFGLAQTSPPVGTTFLASDGNLYGVDTNPNFFSYSPATGQTKIISTGVNFSQLCLERSDGTFLSVNKGQSGYAQFIKVSFAGEITPIAQTSTTTSSPNCPALASDGNYYGSSSGGGSYGDGYLYQLTAAGKFTVFYNFTGKADGYGPYSTPIQASDGNLYFFASTGLLRYSPTTGLVIFPTDLLAQAATPLEASDGNFYGLDGADSVLQVQPTGSTTAIYTDTGAGSGLNYDIDGLYLLGSDLAVLEPIAYVDNNCYSNGNFYSMDPIDLHGNPSYTSLFQIGINGGTYTSSFTYGAHLYQGGDGSFFGTVYQVTQTLTGDQQGQCSSTSTQYGMDNQTPAAPVQMTLNNNHVRPGGSAQLTWQVNNAFSKTMQQCYGFGALSGKLATSGTATIEAPTAGSYPASIVCGGTETGLAMLTAGATTLVVNGPTGAPFPIGSPATLTATITNPGSNAPTGKVEFLYGSRVIASATLVHSVATVTVSTSGLPAGTYNIAASYPGDANYEPAKSTTIPIQLVAPAPSSVALAPATQSLTVGGTASLTATVTGTSPYLAPTGTVKFYYGSTFLGTVPLIHQVATFSKSTAGLPPGNYHVTAVYSGDYFNQPSTSPAATVTLVASATTVTVSATPNPVPTGNSFSVSARVTGTGTPTGTVTFSAGTQAIASTSLNGSGTGTVTLPTGTLAPGTYQLTAYYAGDSHNPAATSPAITLTIN